MLPMIVNDPNLKKKKNLTDVTLFSLYSLLTIYHENILSEDKTMSIITSSHR